MEALAGLLREVSTCTSDFVSCRLEQREETNDQMEAATLGVTILSQAPQLMWTC